ncbi:MAG: ribonuclease III [Candidatus Bipolaricaulaceae bacterium]
MTDEPFRRLCQRLQVDLPPQAIRPALVHASYANQVGELESNERLEFLGDAVLDLAVADIVYRRHPDWDEGELSKLRAVVVSRPALAEVARDIGLGELLLLSKGELAAGGRQRPSNLSAALEAVVGTVFLHSGYAEARELALRLLGDHIDRHARSRLRDYKSLLQELGQGRFGRLPAYEVVVAEGPEHRRTFTVRAALGGEEAVGRGRSKKEAEQAAAKRLYLQLADSD